MPQKTTSDTMYVRLRGAKPDDWTEIVTLLDETWHTTYDRLLGSKQVEGILSSLWNNRRYVGNPATSGTLPFAVAEVDGQIVGMASAGLTLFSRSAILWMLYIRPSYQGAGIGGQLMENVLSRLPPMSKTTVEVLPGNHRAIQFYERNGFVSLGEAYSFWSWHRVVTLVRHRAI